MSNVSPYINTEMFTTLSLPPEALNNDLYQNLKNRLTRKLEGRCFRDYGFIVKIYKILTCKSTIIHPEDPFSSGQFKISFSCRLFVPLERTQLVAQVSKVLELLVVTKNGPMNIFTPNDRINDSVFSLDNNNRLRYRHDDNKLTILKAGDFVRISINSFTFNSGSNNIKAIGFLQRMATDDEVKSYYEDLYTTDEEHHISYEEFLEQNSQMKEEDDDDDEATKSDKDD